MTVWVDTREPKGMLPYLTAALGPGLASPLKLHTGDYLINDGDGCSLAIERKEIGDLLNCIKSGSLDRQLAMLTEWYTHRLLIVEGPYQLSEKAPGKLREGRPARESGMGHAAVQMKLLSLQRRLGVPVLWTWSKAETADVIRVLHQKAAKGCIGGQE